MSEEKSKKIVVKVGPGKTTIKVPFGTRVHFPGSKIVNRKTEEIQQLRKQLDELWELHTRIADPMEQSKVRMKIYRLEELISKYEKVGR